jgi:site-specific recombinase XerD
MQAEKRTRTRGNGTGSVFRDPSSGHWIAEVTVGWYMDEGQLRRRYRRKYGFKTKKDAVNYLTELREAKQSRQSVTVSELVEMYMADAEKLSKSKRTAYRIAWKKIRDGIAHRRIDELTVPELQALVDEAGSSYYTKRDIKTLLSHCYKLAIRDDLTDKNRAQYIQIGTPDTAEREIFTEDEIGVLWTDYRQEASEITAQMLVMLYTGIRPGELLTIVKQNVHVPEHYMTGGIKTDKGRNRKIIIPEKLSPVLGWMMLRSASDKIAPYPSKDEFYDAWKQKRTALGIREALTPYCCRHTYVTRLTALKVSPAMLQELAGHEDYETTLDYTHLSVEDRYAEVNRLA